MNIWFVGRVWVLAGASVASCLVGAAFASAAQFLDGGSDQGPVSSVRVFGDLNHDGAYETSVQEFFPFGEDSGGGVRVATRDFDDDGNDELVLAAGLKGGGRVDAHDLHRDGSIGARCTARGTDTSKRCQISA